MVRVFFYFLYIYLFLGELGGRSEDIGMRGKGDGKEEG